MCVCASAIVYNAIPIQITSILYFLLQMGGMGGKNSAYIHSHTHNATSKKSNVKANDV